MAQGKGYWYNPSINQAVEVSRHEIDIKKPSIQNKLKLRNDAKNEIDQLSLKPDNEDLIKMLAVRVGQIRVRDWQKFTSIQLFATGNKLKDYLFSLGELIEHAKEKDKEFQSWDKPTQGLARLLATSWQLKIDNLSTKATQSMSPNQFLKNYMDEGFMEEKNMKEKSNRVRDIPFSEELIRKVEACLSKHEEYHEEQRESLFEDNSFRKECSKWKLFTESQKSQYRAWKHIIDPGVFGIITAYRDEYQQDTDEQGRRNKQRQKDLIQQIKQEGFGVFKLYGAWDEGGGIGKEESLLWYPLESEWNDMKHAGKRLLELTKKWSAEYEQDGAIYRAIPDPSAPIMLWRHKEENWETGEVTTINDSIRAGKYYKLSDPTDENEGKLYINKIKKDLGQAWSMLKKGPKERNFVFEELIEEIT